MNGYRLFLESGPRHKTTMVHVTSLLGCISKGPTTEIAVEKTKPAIKIFADFFNKNGENIEFDENGKMEIIEHITEGYFLGQGSPSVVFSSDYDDLNKSELDNYLKRLNIIKLSIAEYIREKTEEELYARLSENSRSIHEILMHMTASELNYLNGFYSKTRIVDEAMENMKKRAGNITGHFLKIDYEIEKYIKDNYDEKNKYLIKRGHEEWTLKNHKENA